MTQQRIVSLERFGSYNTINAIASFLMQPTTMLKSKKFKDYIKIDTLSFLFLSVSKLRYFQLKNLNVLYLIFDTLHNNVWLM